MVTTITPQRGSYTELSNPSLQRPPRLLRDRHDTDDEPLTAATMDTRHGFTEVETELHSQRGRKAPSHLH
uniref:Uncharacterized protein n=1 Tax=Peronospora matthiolae TaxID=2874970 RepID=A0AAV1V1T9_9STRA